MNDNWDRLAVGLKLAKMVSMLSSRSGLKNVQDVDGIAKTAIDIRPLLLSSLESALQIKVRGSPSRVGFAERCLGSPK